ncbi:MAG: pseudouridine synthase [Flaviflexus sp.]|nr:pseudouridine synthase [Flaviflexus sp.]
MIGERLQKVMAHAGVASRRACEELISDGRVTVDGAVVTRLGTRVTEDQVIRVDGERITFDPEKITIALHKPAGVLSSMEESTEKRPTLLAFLEDRPERLHHVGRLDQETEGLILLSNDGELTHRLTHPSYEVPKTYVATVEGQVSKGAIKRVVTGVELEDGVAKADEMKLLEFGPKLSLVRLTLHSGKNRIVRRLLAEVGHPVQRLVRTDIANITLGRLTPGQYRIVGGSELGALMNSVGL